ncbi:MAG: hypothetical protein WA865_23130 [Spirulinaceae cyanobacterium]
MKLRIIECFDSSFTIEPQSQKELFQLLKNKDFLQQISQEIDGQVVEFTELLFQPVPYSKQTPKGMPSEFEKYHDSPDYAIINVPPNFMFKAKVYKPSRLCAVYRQTNLN